MELTTRNYQADHETSFDFFQPFILAKTWKIEILT